MIAVDSLPNRGLCALWPNLDGTGRDKPLILWVHTGPRFMSRTELHDLQISVVPGRTWRHCSMDGEGLGWRRMGVALGFYYVTTF